jgi:hypothetical protein
LRGYEKGSQANGGLSEKLQRRECADESHVWPTGGIRARWWRMRV